MHEYHMGTHTLCSRTATYSHSLTLAGTTQRPHPPAPAHIGLARLGSPWEATTTLSS